MTYLNPFLSCSLLYLAEGKRDLSAPWARYLGDIAGVTNPKIVIVDLYNQQVRTHSRQTPGKCNCCILQVGTLPPGTIL